MGSATTALATEVSTPFENGRMGSVEHVCTQIIYLLGDMDCSYGRDRLHSSGMWSGPVVGGHYYERGSAGDGLTFNPANETLEVPVSGVLTVDDADTPTDGTDDSIAATFSIGELARHVQTGQTTRAVQRWDSMDHTLAPTVVTTAMPNDAGGFDYVIGSHGEPERLCSATDPLDCFPTVNALSGIPSSTFWVASSVNAVGIERSALLGGNLAATTVATLSGPSCEDQVGGLDCAAGVNIWGGGEDAGFDNFILVVSTGADGQVNRAYAYWTQEYVIDFGVTGPSDNSWSGGLIQFVTPEPDPTAFDDRASTAADTPVSINVLDNDAGFGDAASITITSQPLGGTVAVEAPSTDTTAATVLYTPHAEFIGVDSFGYEVTDGAHTDTATVSVGVGWEARPDEVYLGPGESTYIDVLANDVLFSGDVYIAFMNPRQYGISYAIGSPGPAAGIRIYYQAYCCTGKVVETFQYSVQNGAEYAIGTVTVHIGPRAIDDEIATSGGASVNIPVTANDVGFQYPSMVGIYTNPAHGRAEAGTYSGSPCCLYVTYTPAPGFVGVDTFEYAIDDGYSVGIATVTVTVVADQDMDGIPDDNDNCTIHPNADQRDTNNDGYGNICDADLNNNGVVNFADLNIFRARFGSADPDADLNGSGMVNFADLNIFTSRFGKPPGPSAAH